MNKVTPIDSEHSAIAIINQPSIKEIAATPLSQNMQFCKICLEPETTDIDLLVRMTQMELRDTRLIVPCECSGSVGYVHQKCIKTWIQKQLLNTGRRVVYCQICKSQIFFRLKKSNYCQCKLQNLSFITGCNILSAVTEIVLMFVAILILRYSVNFSDSALFRYVLIIFICILGIAFCLTFALMMGEAFVRTKKYISRIFSLEESEQLGLRQIRAKSTYLLPENNLIALKKKNKQPSNTYYMPSNNGRPLNLNFQPINPAVVASQNI